LQISIKNDYAVVVGFEVNKPEAYAYKLFLLEVILLEKWKI